MEKIISDIISLVPKDILEFGLKAFDNDKMSFAHWLYFENSYVEGKRPIEVINDEKYKTLITDELGRIEYDVYS